MSRHQADDHASTAPSREEINHWHGPAVIEFGTAWCGHCQAAQSLLTQAFAGHPQLRHLKIEDGRGKPLGRSFQVKLWPTLIFLRDGREVARLVRPTDITALQRALSMLDDVPAVTDPDALP